MKGGASLRILGAGGHARVAADAWRSAGGEVAGFHDDSPPPGAALAGMRLLGPIAAAVEAGEPVHLAIGDNRTRERLSARFEDRLCPPVVHRETVVSPSAAIGAGTLVGAGAVVQADAVIGRHAIINSCALIEHDCRIGDFVHVAPGVRLAGSVSVGNGAFVGIGAIVIPGIAIGAGATVGAGAVVIADVAAGAVVAGVPARVIRPAG